ncbi:Plastocyanin-like [Macleaya cordata]|uniref:Plastocyanin-like n=1 Tax=Macleaya cordata TaxID=56857 RepID=A0A200PN17_MACCD|nr:Plastocyanin-like [Macleaya cordata]
MAIREAVVAACLLVFCFAVPSLATVYTVGDAEGWTMGVDYSTWASGKTFVVGDTLVFTYGGGHTVDEVSATDYASCTMGNSISSDSTGAIAVALKTSGTHYFVCGMMGHCDGGMKLAVTVDETTETSSPSLTPSPSPLVSTPSTGATFTTTPAATKPVSSSTNTTIAFEPIPSSNDTASTTSPTAMEPIPSSDNASTINPESSSSNIDSPTMAALLIGMTLFNIYVSFLN